MYMQPLLKACFFKIKVRMVLLYNYLTISLVLRATFDFFLVVGTYQVQSKAGCKNRIFLIIYVRFLHRTFFLNENVNRNPTPVMISSEGVVLYLD